jgi:hypothetical protein
MNSQHLGAIFAKNWAARRADDCFHFVNNKTVSVLLRSKNADSASVDPELEAANQNPTDLRSTGRPTRSNKEFLKFTNMKS